MNASEFIKSVFSGSCTPGYDLLEAVAIGRITKIQADEAVKRRKYGHGFRPTCADDLARSESAYVAENDV